MKFKYTFQKLNKIIIVNMLYSTMFIYKRYIRKGYIVTKREILIDNEWIDIDKLLTEIL